MALKWIQLTLKYQITLIQDRYFIQVKKVLKLIEL